MQSFRRAAVFFFCFFLMSSDLDKQFGRMPVLEEARTIDYVTNHNVITIDHHGDEHFQNIKNGGRTRGNIGVKYSLLFRFHFDFSMPNYRKR